MNTPVPYIHTNLKTFIKHILYTYIMHGNVPNALTICRMHE